MQFCWAHGILLSWTKHPPCSHLDFQYPTFKTLPRSVLRCPNILLHISSPPFLPKKLEKPQARQLISTLQTFALSYTTAKPGKYLILYNCSFSILLQWCQSVVHTRVTNCSPSFSSDVHETGCVLSEYSNCKLFKWCFLIIFQDESGTMLTNASTCGDVLPPTSSRQPPLGDLSPLSIHWNISSVCCRNGLRQSPGLSVLQSSMIQGAATIGSPGPGTSSPGVVGSVRKRYVQLYA